MDGEPKNTNKNTNTPWDNIAKEVPDSRNQNSEQFTISPEQENTHQFVELKELEPIFNDKNGFILGHGTNTARGNQDKIQSILNNGLTGYHSVESEESNDAYKNNPVGDTDLRSTTIGLYSGSDGKPIDMSALKYQLNHWKHLSARNIILIKLPIEYTNFTTSNPEYRYYPYFIQKRDEGGQMRNYLDPRLIIGNYSCETGLVEINNKFENELSDEFRAELEQRFKKSEELNQEYLISSNRHRGLAPQKENDKTEDENNTENDEDSVWGNNLPIDFPINDMWD